VLPVSVTFKNQSPSILKSVVQYMSVSNSLHWTCHTLGYVKSDISWAQKHFHFYGIKLLFLLYHY